MTSSGTSVHSSTLGAELKAYLINLDRSTERLQHMSLRLNKISLIWERISAVDGRELNLESDPNICLQRYRRFHGKNLNPAEVGCYMSHIRALNTFLDDSQAQFGLILEDDVQFADDFVAVLSDLTRAAELWDMVKLSGFHTGTPIECSATVGNARKLCIMLTRHTGAAAYLVNRKAANTYVNKLLPMCVPYDHAFGSGWELNLKIRLVSPIPTVLDAEPSTIGYGIPIYRKFPWYRRLGTLTYRARTECNRVLYALREWTARS